MIFPQLDSRVVLLLYSLHIRESAKKLDPNVVATLRYPPWSRVQGKYGVKFPQMLPDYSCIFWGADQRNHRFAHGVSPGRVFFIFSTLVTGPGRSFSLKLSDTRVYEPQIRARLGTTGMTEFRR